MIPGPLRCCDSSTLMENFYKDSGLADLEASVPKVLSDFLETQKFEEALAEIRGNSASCPAFRKRFWRWFNMFRIMKFLHFARERGYPDIPVGEASLELLQKISPDKTEVFDNNDTGDLIRKYLIVFRRIDRSTI